MNRTGIVASLLALVLVSGCHMMGPTEEEMQAAMAELMTRPEAPTNLASGRLKKPIPQPISIAVMPGRANGARIVSGFSPSLRSGLVIR